MTPGEGPGRLPPGAPRFVFHRDYVGEQATGPYDLMRPYRILHYLRREGLLRRGSLHRPRPASLKRLRLVHTHLRGEGARQPLPQRAAGIERAALRVADPRVGGESGLLLKFALCGLLR